MHRRSLPILLFPLVAGAALASPPVDAKVKVAATLPSLAAIAAEVGGDHVEVESLSSAQQDPHYVDPRPSIVIKLARADLLVVNGLELERSWLAPVLLQSRNGRIAVGSAGYFDASLVVKRLGVPQGAVDRSMGDVHPGGNPHFLFDPRQGARVADALGKKLAEIDAEHAADYAKNAAALAASLRAYADEERQRFAALPASRRKVVSYHESLAYLYDWLALERVATLEPRPGIPPDPGHVAKVLKRMKAEGAAVIVQEEFYPASTSSTLSRLAGGRVVKLFGGARFDDDQTYLAHLKQNAEALHDALSR